LKGGPNVLVDLGKAQAWAAKVDITRCPYPGSLLSRSSSCSSVRSRPL